jgi:nucleoside triphosphatase
MEKASEQVFPDPTVAGVIVAPSRQLLLVRSPKWGERWTIPGGHAEVGERLEDAVVGEVKDESGLDVVPVEMLLVQQAVFSREFHRRKHFIFIDYVCAAKDPGVKLDGYELTEHRWVNPYEALDMNLSSFVRNLITKYVQWITDTDNWQKLTALLGEESR